MSVSEQAKHDVPPEPREAGLKVRGRRAKSTGSTAAGAFGWSLANTLLTRLGTLAIGIILARVLGPEQFGTFAVAMVALTAVLSFNELGVSLAIVRWPGNPQRIAATVNTISVVSSMTLCTLGWAATPSYAAAMGSPEATDVVRLLILSVVINGIVAGPAALLQREFREKTRMGIDLVNVWTGTILSLVLVLTGMGAMALAIGRLTGAIIAAILFLRASPLPYRFGWDRSVVGPLLRFGLPLAGTSAIVFGVGYADQLVAGSVVGAVGLGFYVLAFNLASWPVSIVSQPLRRVAPAAFSVLQDQPDRLRRSMLGLFGLLAAATLPAFLAIAGAAVPLVRLVYGEEWVPAAAALSWLVVSAMVKLFCELTYDLIVVTGRTGTVFWIQCVSFIVLVPSLIVGALWGGIGGVAAAQAVVSLVVMLPLYLWQLRHIGIRFTEVLRQIAIPVLGGLAAGAFSWWASSTIAIGLVALGVSGAVALGLITLQIRFRWDTVSFLRTIGTSDRKAVAE